VRDQYDSIQGPLFGTAVLIQFMAMSRVPTFYKQRLYFQFMCMHSKIF
jgi:hypothetical protein